MNFICRVVIVSALVLPLCGLRAAASKAPAGEVRVDGIDLVNAGMDSIHFSVHVRAIVSRSIKVRRIAFSGMLMGGVPVYLGPLEGPLDMKGGQPFSLPAIPLTVYFRDLKSLAPIERAISDSQIRVEGRARVELELNLIQKLALQQLSAQSEIPIQQGVPVVVPGGDLARLSVLAALRAADVALSVAGSTLGSLHRSQTEWDSEINRQYVPALLLAESRYSVMTTDGRRLDLVQDGVGFRIPNRRFVLTAELVSPWKYNPEVAAMLDAKQAQLIPESIDLVVWPGGGPVSPETARFASQGSIRVVQARDAEEKVEVPEGGAYARVRVGKRDSNRNLAILEFTHMEDAGPIMPLASNNSMQTGNWDRIALFRFSAGSAPEILFVNAHRQGDRLALDTPVDETAFGSPAITPEGAVAMVQDQQSGMFLNRLL